MLSRIMFVSTQFVMNSAAPESSCRAERRYDFNILIRENRAQVELELTSLNVPNDWRGMRT